MRGARNRIGVALVILTAAACGGRAIGGPDPGDDGGTTWPPDGSTTGVPDAAIVPPDAGPGCEGSPVRGQWSGTFTGEVDSDLTGQVTVAGSIELEINCEETLLVHGFMEGATAGGVPFEAYIEGAYDEEQDVMRATWSGTVSVVPANGDLQGVFLENPQEHITGTWQGTAPEVDGTGNGHWTVGR